MSRHDSSRPKFLLLGPIEEVKAKPATVDDDGTQELVDELEQILAGGQAALPSPDDFDDYDDTPFAPRRVVTEAYDPYRDAYGDDFDDDDDAYYDDVYDNDDQRSDAVDYWLPVPYDAPPAEQRRLPPPAAEPPLPSLLPRRIAFAAGIAAIFVFAAAATYFVFKLTSNPAEPATEVAATAEPVAANAAAAPAVANTPEPVEPPVVEAPATAEAAPAGAPEPVITETPPVLVNVERIEPRVAAEPLIPVAAADEAATIEPAAEEPVPADPPEAAPIAQAPAPVITNAPVTDFGVTTAWVNLRTGPSNAFEVIGVVASGAEIGIVSCERWCEVEANGARGWIHSDYVLVGNAPAAVAELVEAEPAVAAVAAPFTANAGQTLGIYDSPYEDGEIALTVRNGGEIFIVGCDANWCETRFGDNRRGWVDRRLVQMPADITEAMIPALPPISREEATALRAAAL